MLVLFVMLLDEFLVFIIVFVFFKCYCFISFEIKFIVGIKIIKFRLEWKDLFYVSDDKDLN